MLVLSVRHDMMTVTVVPTENCLGEIFQKPTHPVFITSANLLAFVLLCNFSWTLRTIHLLTHPKSSRHMSETWTRLGATVTYDSWIVALAFSSRCELAACTCRIAQFLS